VFRNYCKPQIGLQPSTMKSSFVSAIALAAGLGVSSTIPQKRFHDGLEIKIITTGNSEVKAIITNVGTTGLRLLKEGTILDKAPVEKFQVHSESKSK